MTHTLALEIDHAHEKAGWIRCWLTIDDQRHILYGSQVFPSFMQLLHFVRAVAGQRFPARYLFNEEDTDAVFEATALADDSPFVHLKITHHDRDPDEPETVVWLDADIERDTIIQAFLPPVLDVSENFSLAEKQWEMPRQTVIQIQQSIARGIPSRLNIHAPQPVDFRIWTIRPDGTHTDSIFLDVIFSDGDYYYFLSQDTSPFWPQLISFMEKISAGNFPVESVHFWGTGYLTFFVKNTMFGIDRVSFKAEPVADPHNFRLKIFTFRRDEAEYLFLDEIVDRRQITRSFAEAFNHFLQNEYQMRPDPKGNTFDLRSLAPRSP